MPSYAMKKGGHVRLLLFADLHLDTPDSGMSPEDSRAAFRRICELAGSLRVDAVCAAGNLFDNDRLAPDTAAVLRTGFDEINPIPVFIAPGTTDWLIPGSIYRGSAWSRNVHVFREPHLSHHTLATGFTLWGAAHVQPVHPLGFLGTGETRPGGVNVALFHGCERAAFAEQSTTGSITGPITAPFHGHQVRSSGLNHALVGHLPAPSATPDYTYPGTRGAVLVTVHSDGSVQQEWYDVLEQSPFTKEPDPPAPPAEAAPATATAVATVDPFAGQAVVFDKADAQPSGAVPAVRVAASVGVDATYDATYPEFPESTVRGQFVRSVRRSQLTESERQRVLAIGLAALDGRTDLGEL
jgi:exonuclease SbcD